MEVAALAYSVVAATDLEAWVRFGEDVAGFSAQRLPSGLALQGSRLFASGARLGAAEGERQARVSAAILLHGYCRALVHELPVDALHELPPAS